MNKYCFLILLALFVICKGGASYSCFSKCFSQIRKPARNYQSCIVSDSLLNLAKSNPQSVAKLVVSTVSGATTTFDKCQNYFDIVGRAVDSLLEKCKKKCAKRKY